MKKKKIKFSQLSGDDEFFYGDILCSKAGFRYYVKGKYNRFSQLHEIDPETIVEIEERDS